MREIPETNDKYAEAIMNEMQNKGYIVCMKFTTRRESLKKLRELLFWRSYNVKKHLDNSALDSDKRKVFWNN